MTISETDTGLINLPNILTSLRLVIAPVMLHFAWVNNTTFFLIFFIFSLLLGFTDGLLARRLNQVTELGARLDSWSDLSTFL